MSAVIVKRFTGGYAGTRRYSIRKHADGTFQIYHDNPYEGIPQSYQHDYVVLTGRYAHVEAAEAELLRLLNVA